MIAAKKAISTEKLIRMTLATLVLLSLAGLAGCEDVNRWRQKMVVEVETPEGVVVGESVVAIEHRRTRKPFRLVDGSWQEWIPHGEAVVVDLGKRGYLFALLKADQSWSGDAGRNALAALRASGKVFRGLPEAMAAVAEWPVGERIDLPREAYPLLVTFRDRSNPKTIRRVNPKNLAATFGYGVRLKRLTLEKTRERVVKGALHDLLPGLTSTNRRWVPLNEALAIDDPMHHVPDRAFWRGGKL